MNNALSQFLETVGLKFIRVIWCDNANIIRGKAIHIGALSHHYEHGVGISAAQQAIPVMYDTVVAESGLGPVGEIRLVPDWSTFKQLPYAPTHGRVMGNMVRDNLPWALCPRNFLQRMVAEASSEGFEVMAAFENEFYLLRHKPDGGIAPADNTVFASTLAMDSALRAIDYIAEALIKQGIAVFLLDSCKS